MHLPVKIFISYAHEDEWYRKELTKHLSSLKHIGLVKEWSDRLILPGDEWNEKIKSQINDANIILFLVSADFMASDYIFQVELESAIRRHKEGKVIIIPIILKNCNWHDLQLGRFQVLPTEAKPIANWEDKDDAFTDIVEQLAKLIREKAGRGENYPKKQVSEIASPTSEYNKISCDRVQLIKFFWRKFVWKEEEGFTNHFYFMIGQRFGQANSLVKRIITELSWERQGVKYQGFDEIEPISLRISGSETSNDLQLDFRRLFNRFLSLRRHVKNVNELVKNIDTHYNHLKKHEFIPVFIELTIPPGSWQENVANTIEWFTNSFVGKRAEKGPQFISFFIISVLGKPVKKKVRFNWIRRTRNKPIAEDTFRKVLEDFINKIEHATLLPALVKVSKADLNDWYKRFENNEKEREKKVDMLEKRLPGNEPWSMSDVEIELKRIVENNQNKTFNI